MYTHLRHTCWSRCGADLLVRRAARALRRRPCDTRLVAALNADAPGGSLLEEFHLKTHWKVLLAGQRGAGMFNHSDSLGTSSWHAHLAGAKWWHVCAPDGAACAEAVVSAGEVVFYGPGYTARRGLRRGRG